MTRKRNNRGKRRQTDGGTQVVPTLAEAVKAATDNLTEHEQAVLKRRFGKIVAAVDVEGVALEDAPTPITDEPSDVDAMIERILGAEPDGPTLEPDELVGTSSGSELRCGGPVGPGSPEVPSTLERIGSGPHVPDRVDVCAELEHLVAAALGEPVEDLRAMRGLEVFPDADDVGSHLDASDLVVVVLRFESGSLFLKCVLSTLGTMLRELDPGAGLGALVQAVWNEQAALELGRLLDSADAGQE